MASSVRHKAWCWCTISTTFSRRAKTQSCRRRSSVADRRELADDAATWTATAERVGLEMGLHFPPQRRADLERGIGAAADAFGQPDAIACARWLVSVAWTRRHIDVLARHLTIGETYFMRDRTVFDALQNHVLPALLRA